MPDRHPTAFQRSLTANLGEERPDILHEQLRLLHCGKVAAVRHRCVMGQVVLHLDPFAGRHVDLHWELGKSQRDLPGLPPTVVRLTFEIDPRRRRAVSVTQ